ncbi:SusF/SusE family outer membrane protein [Mucilaginibacter sp. OK283]|uniref:SusF/SusE family outer membrane protein n=1 Tax=Mucilaginibacter sp. OK283 TaxID=1881049 RepID=UPI0008BC40C6|nr:SusF/SusE family outer membrane protein [Mucilaginibacter sp. OK283]SEP40497.1 protein of unknown function [Mucilaginibacter sp. OK283]
MKALNFNDVYSSRYKNSKPMFWGLLLLSVFALLTFSCKKDNIMPQVTSTPVLSATSSTIVLTRDNKDQQAVTLKWSAAAVKGLQGSVTYFLQWDLKGSNFANATNVKLGRDTLTKTYTQEALNNLFYTLPIAAATQVEVRIVIATSDGSVSPFNSNTIGLTVTTYNKVIPPPYSALWMVGDATPKGWDIGNATPMVQDGTDPYLFTYTGLLVAGEFKIATVKDFGGAFYRPLTNHPDLAATTVQVSSGDPDNKWQIAAAKAGNYKITLNLHNNSISIVNTDPPKAPFSQLWLLGDASPGGWSLDAATPLVVDASDSFIFTWTGPLVAGDFKIATAKDFNEPFYRPTTNAPDLSVTAVQLNAGDPDNKWHIAIASTYKITLNLRTNTISIVNTIVSTPPYTALWIIGDASPGGWSLDAATPMVKNATDPFVFTWAGPLVAGEFKIGTAKDFGAKFYRPVTDHPALSATTMQLSSGDPDNKWVVTASTAGNYKITLNMKDLSIAIIKQ